VLFDGALEGEQEQAIAHATAQAVSAYFFQASKVWMGQSSLELL